MFGKEMRKLRRKSACVLLKFNYFYEQGVCGYAFILLHHGLVHVHIICFAYVSSIFNFISYVCLLKEICIVEEIYIQHKIYNTFYFNCNMHE